MDGGPRRCRRQYRAITIAATLVAAVRARRRIRLPPAPASACAFGVVPVIAAGFVRSRSRDALVWAAQMWAYKNAVEMPADREGRLRRRAHFDYPLALDAAIGAGAPPGQRLARGLRRRDGLSALDKALSFFYWSWEIEPHAVIGWIRWHRPEDFPAAAGRLALTFDLTLLGYWGCPPRRPGGSRRSWGG